MFGAAIFPVVGGYLTNWSWRTPFLTYLAAVPLGLYAFIRMDESVSGENSQIDLSEALGALWDREILKLMGAALLNEVVLFGTVLTILPFILESNYGLNATQIGFVFMASTLSTVVFSSLNGFFAKRLSDNRIIATGVLLYGIGSLVSWIAGLVLMLGIAASMLGVGVGLCMPSIDSAISGSIVDEKRASILSVRNSTTFLGRTTGPILYTFAASLFGYESVLLFAGLVVILIGLFAFLKS
jgi:MFS family permease